MSSSFEKAYLQACQDQGVEPKIHILKANPGNSRFVVTHGHLTDEDIGPLIFALSTQKCVLELGLNFNENLTDKGCNKFLQYVFETHGITSLELLGNHMTEKVAATLMGVLQKSQLSRLKVGDNQLGPTGATILSKGLVGNIHLTQLHLGGNSISDTGLGALISALHNNHTLTSLGLRDNGIGPDGMKTLAVFLSTKSCPFLELQIKGNHIADPGACHLATAVEVNTSLRVLELQSNFIGAKGCSALCQALARNRSIYAINMNDNQISDAGAEAIGILLQANATITTIGISKNHIAEKGAKAIGRSLKVNRTLTGLDIGTNHIGDIGVTALSDALCCSLSIVSIDLHHNNIHLEGIISLTDALLQNQVLRHVDVGSNYSRNPGAFAWAKVIEVNTVITRLCLTDNEIGHVGGEALRQAMAHNTTLRNFCFGGQSTEHPYANHISASTRRSINTFVNRNKVLYSEQLHVTDAIAEGSTRPAKVIEKNLVNSYRNRPITEKVAANGASNPAKVPKQAHPWLASPHSFFLPADLLPVPPSSVTPSPQDSQPKLSAAIQPKPSCQPSSPCHTSIMDDTDSANSLCSTPCTDSSASFFVGAWPAQVRDVPSEPTLSRHGSGIERTSTASSSSTWWPTKQVTSPSTTGGTDGSWFAFSPIYGSVSSPWSMGHFDSSCWGSGVAMLTPLRRDPPGRCSNICIADEVSDSGFTA